MRTGFLSVVLVLSSILIARCAQPPVDSGGEGAIPAFPASPVSAALPARISESSAIPTQTVVLVSTMVPPSPTAAAETTVGEEICSPLAEHDRGALPAIVSAPYTAPLGGREERHHGVDFAYYQNGQRASIAGEGVQSILAGRVALVLKESFPYGNAVILETRIEDLPESWKEAISAARQTYQLASEGAVAGSVYFLFAHLQDPPVLETDQRLTACSPLGAVGKSGNAGVAHLHLELRIGPANAQLGDMGYYLFEITPSQREAYLRWRISGEFQHIDPMALLALE